MKEWEKLQKGFLYYDLADELFERRLAAKELFRKYNRTDDRQMEYRSHLMAEMFHEVGTGVLIEPMFQCEFGTNISIGDYVYINFGCTILDCAEVTIGNHVLIGPNAAIYAVNHCLDPEERIKGGCFSRPIHIEDNVWLGGNVTVLPGVTIGEGAVIGAGSVVVKDIPPRVIAAGNPCRVIREITERDKKGFYLDDRLCHK